jgi:hypothetical protein
MFCSNNVNNGMPIITRNQKMPLATPARASRYRHCFGSPLSLPPAILPVAKGSRVPSL